jgi:hypothetical protein
MKNRINKIVLAVVFSVFVFAGSAGAAFLDAKDLRIRYLFPDMTTDFTAPMDVVVGPGVEANFGFGTPLVDVSDTNIYFDFSISGAAASFNGFQFIDYTNTIASFGLVTIAGTNLAFNAASITFDANNIWVNFQGLSSGSNGFVSLNISPVPEPSTLLLLGSGLVGLGFVRRRFKK